MRNRTRTTIMTGVCIVAALSISPPAYASSSGCTGNPGNNGSK